MRQDAGSGPILAEPLIRTFEVGYLAIIHPCNLMRQDAGSGPILVGSLVRTFEAPHRGEWPGCAGNNTEDQEPAAVVWFVACEIATVGSP